MRQRIFYISMEIMSSNFFVSQDYAFLSAKKCTVLYLHQPCYTASSAWPMASAAAFCLKSYIIILVTRKAVMELSTSLTGWASKSPVSPKAEESIMTMGIM